MSVVRPAITGIVLAGGRARRWNGQDKGLIPVIGRPMIEHVLEALTPQCDDIIISANRNLEAYGQYGWPVVPDQVSDFLGPLAGLSAGMQATNNDWVVLTPCDTPSISGELVDRLWAALVSQDGDVATAHDGRRAQPAFALLPCRLLGDLDAYIASGERKIGRWLERQQRVYADFSDCPDTFTNVNSAEDCAAFEALAQAAGFKYNRPFRPDG